MAYRKRTNKSVYRSYDEFARAHLRENESEPDATMLGQALARETVERIKSHLDRLVTAQRGAPKGQS